VLPRLVGRPIRVELRRSLGAHLAAASLPRRVILLDRSVLVHRGDFERILVHEIFHFIWRRLSNAKRRSWEDLLASEFNLRAKGELGWSAEWRKAKLIKARLAKTELVKSRLPSSDPIDRSPAWRRYACESFCDSAAWLFAGLLDHDEFTLAARFRQRRKIWFTRTFPMSVEVPV
jgi:hypothetical protein